MCSPDEKAGQKETCPECSNVNVIPLQKEPDAIQTVVVIPNGCPKCKIPMLRHHKMNWGLAFLFGLGLAIFVISSVIGISSTPNSGWQLGIAIIIATSIADHFWASEYKCPVCGLIVDA
jgi:predicted RNA-binding Zn-ribbon protein involved in translation (DUF1610 family)